MVEKRDVRNSGVQFSGCAEREAPKPAGLPVAMAKGIHLFPYRTQKLSPCAPMVLGWRRPGRVGRCRIPMRKAPRRSSGRFSLCLVLAALSWYPPLPLILVKKIVKTGRKEGIWAGHIEYDTQSRRAGHLGLMRSLPQSDGRENQDDNGPGTDTAIDPG